jgi:hypothetical protein
VKRWLIMRRFRLITTGWLAGWLLCQGTVSAAPCPPVAQQIVQLVHEKAQAVNRRDWISFQRVLHPDCPVYMQEQKRWFQDAIRYVDRGSYRLDVLSVIPYRPYQVLAWVEQSYRRKGTRYAVKFPLLFQRTDQGWRDSDYPFRHMTGTGVIVRYTDQRLHDQATVALGTVQRSLVQFRSKYGWTPRRDVEVKLYHHPEVFRQSVKLSLPMWAAGWHEAGQAIKFVGLSNVDDWEPSFAMGIVHEMTHHMISELTGDNAAYWLQEGAAGYYQSHLLPGLKEDEDPTVSVTPLWTVRDLEQRNLERLSDVEATQFYAQSRDFFQFLVERYGEKKLQRLFAVLAMFPVIDQDSSDKLAICNARTRKAVQKALGKSLDRIGVEWVIHKRKAVGEKGIENGSGS